MSVLSQAFTAARDAGALHNNAETDDDGFIVCKCGVPLPSWDVWGDHYAQESVDAVLKVIAALEDEVEHHIVEFTEDDWMMKHPLACRPNLFDCPVSKAAMNFDGYPTAGPGRYRVEIEDDELKIGEKVT